MTQKSSFLRHSLDLCSFISAKIHMGTKSAFYQFAVLIYPLPNLPLALPLPISR